MVRRPVNQCPAAHHNVHVRNGVELGLLGGGRFCEEERDEDGRLLGYHDLTEDPELADEACLAKLYSKDATVRT